MAASDSKHELQSAQEHIPTCEKHNFTIIDITCEDCDEFICTQCAKTDHKDHDWKTIPTAGCLKRRELKKTLSEVKEEDLKNMDEKIKMATKQMQDNLTCCDSEISKLQNHYDAIVSILNEIKRNFETKLRENLERKNAEVSEKILELENKREHITDLLKFLEEKHNTMSDYSLIDNLRDLTNLMSNTDSDIEKGIHSVRYRRGEINDGSLETMMGQMLDFDDITAIKTDYFKYEDNDLTIVEAFSDDTCFVSDMGSKCIERLHIKEKTTKQININLSINDACVAANEDVYVTNSKNKSIFRLSPSGTVSSVFSTAPLRPVGICPSTEGGLLVTLTDTESEKYQPDQHSRRLVRHVTLAGDVIREYEYQEDGQNRLFIGPFKIRQNGNNDIGVVNMTSEDSSELVILSLSGSLKSVYREQRMEYFLFDVVCDFYCNYIVCDLINSKIIILSPDRKFLKYLLTETEVTNPASISLYKSTLWVCDENGIKVFQYKT